MPQAVVRAHLGTQLERGLKKKAKISTPFIDFVGSLRPEGPGSHLSGRFLIAA